jgi:endonuclease IV
MAANNIRIGYHVNKKSATTPVETHKTSLDAIKHAYEKHSINTMQIWSHVSKSGKAMNLDFVGIKKYITDNNISLYTHGSYPTISIYKGSNIDKMTSELDSAQKLGAKGVVIHINKFTPETIIKTLKDNRKIWEKYKVPILIENSAYTSKSKTEYSYNTVEKINDLYDKLSKEFPKSYVKGCLDTAHLSSAGVDPETWVNIKLDNIELIHLNGSEKVFGCGVDKHAIPFYIKKDNVPGETDTINKKHLIAFAKHCRNIPMVIEANRGDTSDLLKAIKKIKKL